MLEVGTTAPQITLADQQGTTRTLNEFLGNWVLIYFYPKDNTPGCTREACGIRDTWDRFEQSGVTVLGISADSVESHQKFIKDHQLPFTLLSDPEKKVIKAYEALGEKMMFGKKYTGILRVSYLIDPEGKIRRAYSKVQPNKHAEQILKDMTELKK